MFPKRRRFTTWIGLNGLHGLLSQLGSCRYHIISVSSALPNNDLDETILSIFIKIILFWRSSLPRGSLKLSPARSICDITNKGITRPQAVNNDDQSGNRCEGIGSRKYNPLGVMGLT
jgi:hypothetical protein